ncbi:MAG: sulfatase-like hydrolase/transferase [Acidobacteria bacterium]|nr:sulfatase-like hydrolase/transferase [Acidobacteriota bacterium]
MNATGTRRRFLQAAAAAAAHPAAAAPVARPNIVQILIDDLGYADLACYGGQAATPNIDRLAAEGVRFTQAYVASPVCSPSRVGITTGQCPARHFIYSFLDTREKQRSYGMRDFLDPRVPCIARTFQQSGYATAHAGKWHMGGGRDVGDAPLPAEYGFDESLTSFEGLGDRVLPPGRLSEMNEKLGRGKIAHAAQRELTGIYVDRSIDFVRRSVKAAKPFYLHLWPNEVHDAYDPKPEMMKKYERFSSNKYLQQYLATIDDMDRQIGRLIDTVNRMGLAENTLFILLSDNGPTAWPRYYKEKLDPPGSTAGLRGRKWSLYEGGIRVPLIASWKGKTPAGRTDRQSVVSSLDFYPTCCALAGVPAPKVAFDGEDMSQAFLGRPRNRKKDLFWDYGRDPSYQKPGLPRDQSPNLALRRGRWKLLVNDDGSDLQLYDFARSDKEETNVAAANTSVADKLGKELLSWRRSLPVLGTQG